MWNRPILVIDPDPLGRELVTDILTGWGFEVLSAPDGPSGIEMALAARPAVIFLDMVIPGTDGISTCARLKQDPFLKDIPVVGMTASTDLQYTQKAFLVGVDFFLLKPFGAETLLHIVKLATQRCQPHAWIPGHQRHPRFPVVNAVRCLIGYSPQPSREVVGRTDNLSLGGLLLVLPEELPPGACLRLQRRLPGGTFTAEGVVIWRDPQPMRDGSTRHGIQLVRFVEHSDLVHYRCYLSNVAATHAAQSQPAVAA